MSDKPIGRLEQMAQAIAARVVNLVIETIDINGLVAKVDIEAIVKQVDVESIVDEVDIQRIVDRVDIDRIVDRLDIDKIVDRVDVDKIVDRLDINAIVKRVDINTIVQRVDVNGIVQNIDVEALVEKTELGAIIAKSTTGVLTEVLDGVRARGVGLDDFCARWTNRVLRRDPTELSLRPGMPPPSVGTTAAAPRSTVVSMPLSDSTVERQGQYAGAVSRLAAFAVDIGALWVLFVVGAAVLSFAVELFTRHSFGLVKHAIAADITLGIWALVYFAYQWALAGRTIGMAVFGVKVVSADGSPSTTRSGVVRALILPFSVAFLFVGCMGILTNRERRAWHDRLAGTAVVYAWDARAARLRLLADRDGGRSTESSNRLPDRR